jgi:hypothetical protein
MLPRQCTVAARTRPVRQLHGEKWIQLAHGPRCRGNGRMYGPRPALEHDDVAAARAERVRSHGAAETTPDYYYIRVDFLHYRSRLHTARTPARRRSTALAAIRPPRAQSRNVTAPGLGSAPIIARIPA